MNRFFGKRSRDDAMSLFRFRKNLSFIISYKFQSHYYFLKFYMMQNLPIIYRSNIDVVSDNTEYRFNTLKRTWEVISCDDQVQDSQVISLKTSKSYPKSKIGDQIKFIARLKGKSKTSEAIYLYELNIIISFPFIISSFKCFLLTIGIFISL